MNEPSSDIFYLMLLMRPIWSQPWYLVYPLLANFFGAASDYLDPVRRNALVIKFEVRVFQDKSPHLVTRPIHIQVTLYPLAPAATNRATLNVSRLLTLLASSSVMALSNCEWVLSGTQRGNVRLPALWGQVADLLVLSLRAHQEHLSKQYLSTSVCRARSSDSSLQGKSRLSNWSVEIG